jgi:hypothetical protein
MKNIKALLRIIIIKKKIMPNRIFYDKNRRTEKEEENI